MSDPCKHAPSSWVYRISSHRDDAPLAKGEAFAGVWVCAKPACIDRGKRWVAAAALCKPMVIHGRTRELVDL